MSDKAALGERMKGYEHAARSTLPMRMPVILRVDGKAFHTWTRGCERPFDDRFIAAMDAVAIALCEELQGAVLAYAQSDEISVLLHNYKRLKSYAWFDNQVQKMVSVSASIAAATMTAASTAIFGETRMAFFDSRVFVLPEAEVANYFIWRQQDASRNSVQMVAQALFPQRVLHGRNTAQLQEMIYAESGQNWNDLPVHKRRGRCVRRQIGAEVTSTRPAWFVDMAPPLFTQERDYVTQHLAVEPEDEPPLPRFGDEE